MSVPKHPRATGDQAALKDLNLAINALAHVASADRLQPALDAVATALGRIFPLPSEVKDGDLDEVLAYLETQGFGARVTELATFNRLIKMGGPEDYDDPPIDDAALERLVKGLKRAAQKREAS